MPGSFDVAAVFEVVDAQRVSRDLSWGQLSRSLHWMSLQTIERMRERQSSSCNHILPLIQWVGRTPESFTVEPEAAVHELLPEPAGRGWRWWWNHRELISQLDAKRKSTGMSWNDVAAETGHTFNIQALRRRRYGTSISEAMVIARWLGRSAASFMSQVPPSAWNKLHELRQAHLRNEIDAAALQQAIDYISARYQLSGGELNDWYTRAC